MALIAFFLLTFVTTWSSWSAWAALGSPGSSRWGGPVFLLGVFAPAFVALVLTSAFEGRRGIARLLARIAHWQVDWRWYLFAVAYLPVIKLTAAMIHRLAVGTWPAFGTTPWILMLGAIPVSTWVQAGEEIGWRGYALPRLAARFGLGGASIVLGILWAFWHLPLFLLPDTGSDGQSFPIYLLHVTALSVAMAWLYWRTDGSLLLVMVMHASVNNTSSIVPAAVPGASDPWTMSASAVAWLTVILSWLLAGTLLARMRGVDAASPWSGNRSAPAV